MTFYELERLCKKRRLKRTLLWILFLFSCMGVGIGSYVFFDKSDKNPAMVKYQKTKIETKSSTLIPIVDLNITVDKKVVKKEHNKTEVKKQKPVKISKKNIKEDIKHENKKILSTRVIPPYENCIAIAEEYYKRGDYKEAIKWAKNANIQNKEDKRSWIITAKSLYALGKKEKAVKILRLYNRYYPSLEIETLIKEMQK